MSAKKKARKICPMCEVFGAGPCEECDRLNHKRVPVRKNAERCADKIGITSGTDAWLYFVSGYMRGHRAATRRLS